MLIFVPSNNSHLKVYLRKFSYKTVVELYVPRNKLQRSAKRYHGVVKVAGRRTRKGFSLRYNLDSHRRLVMYQGLNALQYADGIDMVNINRDDTTGFSLVTVTTYQQQATPAVQGSRYSNYKN